MKIDTLKQRLNRGRSMTTITIRMPEDGLAALKRLAPLLGFLDISPRYIPNIAQGLRTDFERLEGDTVSALISSLNHLV